MIISSDGLEMLILVSLVCLWGTDTNTAYLRTRLGRLLSSVMTTSVNKYSAERDSWYN